MLSRNFENSDWPFYRSISPSLNKSLQLTASFWKSFKILSYEILNAKFGFSTQTFVKQRVFHDVSGCSVNFMAMSSLKINKGFNCEDDLGCKVSPRTIFHGGIPYKSLNFTLP